MFVSKYREREEGEGLSDLTGVVLSNSDLLNEGGA